MATSNTRCFLPLLLASAVQAALPLVDFDRMGTVGLAGSFAGLDFFQDDKFTFDAATATLLSRTDDGQLKALAATNTGGRIAAGCALDDVFYFGGSFSSIGSTTVSNAASYTPSSDEFAVLGSNGPNGAVHAVYCDGKNGEVWFGGDFTSPGESVAVYTPKSSSWSKPPFGGLTGAGSRVLSITANSSESSLFFAGSFVYSFGGSVVNGTNNPNVPFSAGATPFSSSLVPVPLSNAEIVASPSSSDSSFSTITNILCPAGDDGAGNTWLAADGNAAVITVRDFSFLSASGVRLGNTFLANHGTTGFTLTTIPDNTVRTLQYLDPTTNQNTTCSDPCPLSTDSSLLYQDFLFTEGSQSITGFEIRLSEWTGDGAGLHILQMLSSGAFASAVADSNGESCYAPGSSTTSRTGDWTVKVANTGISGTTQSVIVSNPAVGTSASDGPSVTWNPYVSASGEYTVNMLVPGCTNFQDCESRTSVKVTVFSGSGNPWVTEVNQQNQDDASVLIYQGPIIPSTDDFVATITMTLSDSPAGSGQNGQYEIVADRVEFVLNSANITSNGGSSGNGTSTTGGRRGFGFFEWPLDADDVDATGSLNNNTETALDSVGIDLFSGMGSGNLAGSSNATVAAVAHHSSGTIFLAGNISISSGDASGASHLVKFEDGSLKGVNGGGLNGPVNAMVLVGDQLFVGGAFSDTSAQATGSLNNVAVYDVTSDKWGALGDGVDGTVLSMSFKDDVVLVAGSFGLMAWNPKSSAWVTSGGFIVGSLSFVGNGTDALQFVGGSVTAAQSIGSSGMIFLKNSANDIPAVTSLSVQLEGDVKTSSTSARRSTYRRHVSKLMNHPVSTIFRRQSSSSLPALPTPLPATAPSVLAGTFWTNSSSHEVTIIGGNFSFASGSNDALAVAIYDSQDETLTALQGAQIDGTVRTLLVSGNKLYIGGQFTLSTDGTTQNGFAIYDLAKQAWDVSGVQSLSASDGHVTVYSITESDSKDGSVFVAGSFAQAGSLRCPAICALDTNSKQWTNLGDGVKGEIASVVYAGSDTLLAGGSLTLSDDSPANVAVYTISNSSWSAVGADGIAGPVTALEVNDNDMSKLFAAGKTTDGDNFLTYWNGQNWTSQDATFDTDSVVSQLAMIPLQNTHSAGGVIQADRMLMISGTLDDPSFGNASSALYDGKSYIPYITSSSSSGTAGAVAALFHSFKSFSFEQRHFLATGIVILISIAISAGVVFLLALIGILWTLFSRRDSDRARTYEDEAEDDDSTHRRPSSLLEHINAATRATVFGEGYEDEHEKNTDGGHDPYGPDASNYLRAETPSDAFGGGMMSDEASRPARARYSFDGVGEGELRLSAGAEIEILDDRDAAWWYARDLRTGAEGVVPAAYLY